MTNWDKWAAVATNRAAQRYNERDHALHPFALVRPFVSRKLTLVYGTRSGTSSASRSHDQIKKPSGRVLERNLRFLRTDHSPEAMPPAPALHPPINLPPILASEVIRLPSTTEMNPPSPSSPLWSTWMQKPPRSFDEYNFSVGPLYFHYFYLTYPLNGDFFLIICMYISLPECVFKLSLFHVQAYGRLVGYPSNMATMPISPQARVRAPYRVRTSAYTLVLSLSSLCSFPRPTIIHSIQTKHPLYV